MLHDPATAEKYYIKRSYKVKSITEDTLWKKVCSENGGEEDTEEEESEVTTLSDQKTPEPKGGTEVDMNEIMNAAENMLATTNHTPLESSLSPPRQSCPPLVSGTQRVRVLEVAITQPTQPLHNRYTNV
jgi:hypothetical protein